MAHAILTRFTRQSILDAAKEGKLTVLQGKVTKVPASAEFPLSYNAEGADFTAGIPFAEVKRLGLKVGSPIKVYLAPSGGLIHMVETQ